ncbi:unannotated protein [freshwater metagenome]|uniref:Unannotated protein n=1 Tax=freshwater metagenome TaxID=449393 RepID=A0A6J7VMD5_9ZZZZ
MLNFTGAHTECQRTESTVRRSVRVTANNRHTWLCKAELWSNNVHDSLVSIAERVETNTKLNSVIAECIDLCARHQVSDRLINIDCWGVVIFRSDREIGTTDFATSKAQTVKRLRAGNFMQKMQIDVEQVGFAICAAH